MSRVLQFTLRISRAIENARRQGAVLNARAVIAQAALESAWGESLLAKQYNNLFGIKASPSSKKYVELPTYEWVGGKLVKAKARWKVYDSWGECILDYSRIISRTPWFRDALPHADPPHGDGDWLAWLRALVNPGEPRWATDPKYVQKLAAVWATIEQA